MNNCNVLIVEDELLIANHIENCLQENDFTSAGIAVSYEKALEILAKKNVDIVLLDINIFGKKTGIDIAEEINKTYKIPFIYLTSYSDKKTIDELKKTYPKGYLSKPINEIDLITTVSIVANNTSKNIALNFGKKTYNVKLEELLYINTDHVYMQLVFTDKKELVRTSMAGILEQFPVNSLVQISRSIAINTSKIIKLEGNMVFLENNVSFKITEKYLRDFTSKF